MTHEEMEQTLGRLAEIQLLNQQLLRETLGTMGKLSGFVGGFAEDTKARMDGLFTVAEDTQERINGLVGVVEHLVGVTDHLVGVTDRLVGVTDHLEIGMDHLGTKLAQLAEQQNGNLLRMENAVASLAALIEAFIRGSSNGGKQA